MNVFRHRHRQEEGPETPGTVSEESRRFLDWIKELSPGHLDELTAMVRQLGYRCPLPWEVRDARPPDQYILGLGHNYGWRPQHLRLVMECGHSPAGFLLGGFVLSRPDVVSLADALEQALPDIPDEDTLSPDTALASLDGWQFFKVLHPDDHRLVDFFSGRNKRWLQCLIDRMRCAAFCMNTNSGLPYARLTPSAGPQLKIRA